MSEAPRPDRFASLLRPFGRVHGNLRQTEHTYMVLVAVVIGLAGGLCAVGFRELIHLGQVVFWQTPEYTLEYIYALPWWWKIAAPAGGGLLVGSIVHFFAREAKGHGVPEVMEAVALRGGRIRPRVVIAKMFASGVCIASGGSVGREGPIVQIGSSLGSTVGQWLGVGERRLRTLVGCGAAAGIAGTFNAPVAGALFAVEIILGDFGVSQFSPIVISSVAATVVSRHFLGNFPAFEVPPYTLEHPNELFAYAALGLLAGLLALLFIRVLYGFEDIWDAIRLPTPIKAAAGGAIIGLIALWYPHIYGVGYEAINGALRGELVWDLLLVLAFVKILSVSITIGSGGSGGVFAPSLFIGAMAGGLVGTVVHSVWPDATAGPGAYALVGMGAVVAAGTHAPITAILIIFELTSEYTIILPLMISCIIATLLATRLQKSSIYTLKLLRRGVDIYQGQHVNVLRHLVVGDVMRDDFILVRPEERLMPVISQFIENPGGTAFVVDGDERLVGVITINEIRPIMADFHAYEPLIIARDMMIERDFPSVAPDDTLDLVMKRLGSYRFAVPVIEDGRVVGVIWPEDVIQRYNAEILKRDMASQMAPSIASGPAVEAIPGVEHMSMADIPAPSSFVGRSIAGLDIRNRYDVSILLIKKKREGRDDAIGTPSADYVFEPGDVMLVMGPPDKLRRLERGV